MSKEVAIKDKVLALHQFSNDVMQIWSKTDEVRKLFAPDLNEVEFKFFCGLGITLGANPFKREIWPVKYDKSKPAAIFTGRDFARRKAQEQNDYDGHIAEAVYSNDDFKVVNGLPKHEWSWGDRGDLLGAYFLGNRKNIKSQFFHYVKLSEYNKKQSSWNTMPETMIKKVAEAQGLRMMFQGIFEGTYDESESYGAGFSEADVLGDPIEMPKPKDIEKKVEPQKDDPPAETESVGDENAQPPDDIPMPVQKDLGV